MSKKPAFKKAVEQKTIPLPAGSLPASGSDHVDFAVITTLPATVAGLRMHRSDDWHRVALTTPEPILAGAARVLAQLIDEAALSVRAASLSDFATAQGDEDGDRLPIFLRGLLEAERRLAEVPCLGDLDDAPCVTWTLRERFLWEKIHELQETINNHEDQTDKIREWEHKCLERDATIKRLEGLL